MNHSYPTPPSTDQHGYIYVVDRKKSLIIRGGLNVCPREIEEVLFEHPAIVEAAVVGVPHSSLGDEVGAAVVDRVARFVAPDFIWQCERLLREIRCRYTC